MKLLIKSAGKFVYPKGSSIQAHFMSLQDFSLEVSLNYSLLVALRTARTERINELLSTIEIRKWRNCLLTEEFIDIIKACHFDRPIFHDCGSDYALLFEELKLANEKIGYFEYVMHTTDSGFKSRLSMFHFNDQPYIRISTEPLTSVEINRQSILIINTVLGFRPHHENPPYFKVFTLREAQGCVVALRASKSEIDLTRTTIHGEDVVIPSLAVIHQWMIETDRQWYWRWLPHHDVDFFIPEPDLPDVGVLLAYTSQNAEKCDHFRLLNKKGNLYD